MKRGTLRIESLEEGLMIFISDDGSLKQRIKSSKEDFRKWFCNSTLEQAEKGVRASYDGGNNLMTDQWDTYRRAKFLGGCNFQLSHHFC